MLARSSVAWLWLALIFLPLDTLGVYVLLVDRAPVGSRHKMHLVKSKIPILILDDNEVLTEFGLPPHTNIVNVEWGSETGNLTKVLTSLRAAAHGAFDADDETIVVYIDSLANPSTPPATTAGVGSSGSTVAAAAAAAVNSARHATHGPMHIPLPGAAAENPLMSQLLQSLLQQQMQQHLHSGNSAPPNPTNNSGTPPNPIMLFGPGSTHGITFDPVKGSYSKAYGRNRLGAGSGKKHMATPAPKATPPPAANKYCMWERKSGEKCELPPGELQLLL